ncbi:MAG TPA: LysR substrate-binding domain-containing protein, partial [Polyangiaceae bacterium]|nr:LysR substrate-binding domain-containing protein [Polyangiaceae bacterium]
MRTSRKQEAELFTGVVPFVLTAESASFRHAARELGVTTSSVSKAISKLERELGTRLLHRTSRKVSLTTDGATFLSGCRAAMQHARSAREAVGLAQRYPRGLLRVSLPLPLGRAVLMPKLAEFLQKHPALRVHVLLTDRFVRFEEENVDVAVRIGKLDDSTAVAKRVRWLGWVTAASPDYLARQGTPRTPSELGGHNCLRYELPNGRLQDWMFSVDESPRSLSVTGTLTADHGEALLGPALAGVGLIQAHDYMVASELAAGRLVEVLAPYATRGPAVSVLSAPGRSSSPKVRAFAAFVAEALGQTP